jgi:uncharacterized protein YycO
MKKVYWIFLIMLGGCQTLPRNMNWEASRDVYLNREKLEVGDILIKSREPNPISWFGHSAVVISPTMIGDYPKLCVGYQEIDMYSWFIEKRDVVVLRYKGFDEIFRKKFLENVEKSKNKDYWVNFSKKDEENTYCSKYVWQLYLKTSKELGKTVDLDSDGGILVTPYDILNSEYLEQIKIVEK